MPGYMDLVERAVSSIFLSVLGPVTRRPTFLLSNLFAPVRGPCFSQIKRLSKAGVLWNQRIVV